MANVPVLQMLGIDKIKELATFVDAIQNPDRYLKIIDEALTMLEKLRVLVDSTSKVNNADAYLEQAKYNHAKADVVIKKTWADLDATDKERIKAHQDRIAKVGLAEQELSKTQSRLEQIEAKLTKAQQQLEVSQAHISAQQQHINVAKQDLERREFELRNKSDQLKKLVA